MDETLRILLQDYFDQMLIMTPRFKKKEYEQVFLDMIDQYGRSINEIPLLFESLTPEEEEALMEDIAAVIPIHAKMKMEKLSKRDREKKAIDYNLNMAVYIIPGLSYHKNEKLIKIAQRTVAKWNEIGVTSLQLGVSSYEDISGGFKKRLCFLTTAVCESLSKSDNCYELMTLRKYRDGYLMQTKDGRALVEEYYDIAPALVMIMNMEQDQRVYNHLYKDYIMPCIKHIEDNEPEVCKERYICMVNEVKNKYFPS